MPKLSIDYIIHFILHASFSHLSLTLKFSLKVNLVPYQKSLDTESILNVCGVQIFEHSELNSQMFEC